MRVIITEKMLKKNKACKEGVETFNRLYPDGMDIEWTLKQQIALLLSDLGPFLMWASKRKLLPFLSMRGVELYGADLRECDLKSADLRESDLREADLRGAKLKRADLRNADLRGAKLRDARLTRAKLSGAIFEDLDGNQYKVGE